MDMDTFNMCTSDICELILESKYTAPRIETNSQMSLFHILLIYDIAIDQISIRTRYLNK